jgi:small subunit ribosomal protein S4
LLQFLESRLDNVVFRLGIAPTRAAARQLVLHRHIIVNGKVVNYPSFRLRPGDIIGVRERSKTLEVINDSLQSNRHIKYSWLEWNSEKMEGKFMNIPERSEIPENIKEQLIVELYSK